MNALMIHPMIFYIKHYIRLNALACSFSCRLHFAYIYIDLYSRISINLIGARCSYDDLYQPVLYEL